MKKDYWKNRGAKPAPAPEAAPELLEEDAPKPKKKKKKK